MGNYKFSIALKIFSLDEDDPIPVLDSLKKVFGSYAFLYHLYSDSDDYDYPVEESGAFELRTEDVSAREHLANLSRWRDGLKLLQKARWECGLDMWIFVPAGHDMKTKLRNFYDDYGYAMRYILDIDEDDFEIEYSHGDVSIKFDGLSTRDIDGSLRELKMYILLIDAILQYCGSRSRDELSEETWDDFIKSIRNRELLSYLSHIRSRY
jgi:hypothetical protein